MGTKAPNTAAPSSAQYCMGRGYGARAEELADQVLRLCGVELGLLADAQVTGNFDVRVRRRGHLGFELIHSKKRGDGFVDTEEKRRRIVEAICAADLRSYSESSAGPKTAVARST